MNAEQERIIRKLERQRDACHNAHREPAPIICPVCGKETSIEDLAAGRTVYVKDAAGLHKSLWKHAGDHHPHIRRAAGDRGDRLVMAAGAGPYGNQIHHRACGPSCSWLPGRRRKIQGGKQ